MIAAILGWLAGWAVGVIESTGELGVFVLMAAESANIPIPSEIIMPFGGFAASAGSLSFWGVVFAGALGNLVGSLVSYWIGLKGGRPVLERWGKYLLIHPADLERGHRLFHRYGLAIAFWSRLLPVVRTFISLPAGINRAPLLTFSLFTFLGSFLWSWLLAWLGFTLGENWEVIRPHFENFSWLIVGFTILGIILYVWRHFKNGIRNQESGIKGN